MYGRDSNRLEPKRLVPNLITQNTELTHSWVECEMAYCNAAKNLNMHFYRQVKTPPNLVAFYIFANGALSNVLSHTKALLDYYLNSSLLLILYCDLKSFDLEFTYIYYILIKHK